MTADPWIPLTMRIVALGHSLRDAQRMAAVILIHRLMVFTIMGYRIPPNEPERQVGRFPVIRDSYTGGPAGIRGIFPAIAGTVAGNNRVLFTK